MTVSNNDPSIGAQMEERWLVVFTVFHSSIDTLSVHVQIDDPHFS